jgi:hypothetical protein
MTIKCSEIGRFKIASERRLNESGRIYRVCKILVSHNNDFSFQKFVIGVVAYPISPISLAHVKHGKNSFDVDLDTAQPVTAFKQKLYELTGVEPGKQKRKLCCMA